MPEIEHSIKKNKSEVEITIKIPQEKMKKYFDHACQMISKEVKVKGFRPGKVPYEVLKQNIDESVIKEEAHRLAVQDTYASIVMSENIQVIARPQIDLKESKEDEAFEFTAKVAVLPDVEIKGYEDIKVKAESAEASDKEVDELITNLRRLHQVAEEKEGKAEKGDRVEVDFEGFDETGVALENTKSKNHPIVLGEGNMVPGFEDALIGMTKGDTKEFDVTFPKDYHYEPFKNKKVKFKAELKLLENMNTPELTDELVEKITGQKKSVDEFKKEVKESIEARKKEDERARQEGDFIDQLVKKAKIDVPEVLIKEESEYLLREFKHQVEHQHKMPFSDYLAQNNKTEEDLKKDNEKEADKRVRARLVINHILEAEKIEVEQKDVDAEIQKIIETYPKDQQYEVKKQYKDKSLRSRLANKMKLDRLFTKFLPAYSKDLKA